MKHARLSSRSSTPRAESTTLSHLLHNVLFNIRRTLEVLIEINFANEAAFPPTKSSSWHNLSSNWTAKLLEGSKYLSEMWSFNRCSWFNRTGHALEYGFSNWIKAVPLKKLFQKPCIFFEKFLFEIMWLPVLSFTFTSALQYLYSECHG